MSYDTNEQTSKVINGWLEDARGLPMTLQITRLGFAIATALQQAYDAGAASTPDERLRAILKDLEDERVADLEERDDFGINQPGWKHFDGRAEAFGVAISIIEPLLPKTPDREK